MKMIGVSGGHDIIEFFNKCLAAFKSYMNGMISMLVSPSIMVPVSNCMRFTRKPINIDVTLKKRWLEISWTNLGIFGQ